MKKTARTLVLLAVAACLAAAATAKPVSKQRQQLIDYALTLRGTPYRYGGKTPSGGIDCSGFVAYSSRQAITVNFTGNAQSMYNASKKVTNVEREPGDLLFFSASNSATKITHVGIYLGLYKGKGRFKGKHLFVHAASDGSETGVIVSSIDTPSYWTRHYMGTRRYLPSSRLATTKLKAFGAGSLKSKQSDFDNDDWWKDVDPSLFK